MCVCVTENFVLFLVLILPPVISLHLASELNSHGMLFLARVGGFKPPYL